MLEIGSLVDGKYRVLDEVGRGGMSVVYLARNIRTNKQWAIKEVRKDGTNDFDIVRSNLIAETDILKKLDHPNLPNIIDILDDGDSFIIIMDFIEGNSLQHYLKYSGAQPEEDVVQWAIQLCDVLGYLHSRQPPIIYRDMKPANVMLKPDGNVSLIDFGTAREYKETSIEDTKCLGTQGYAAPEQYGGHGQTDARTDIYCLGATIYHLVTGHNPAEPPYEMYPIRQWNPNLSQGLEQIILKCTQKNPDDRYQSCAELMYALEHRELLDIRVIRAQKRKLALFFTSLFLTILFAVGFFVFGALETSTTAKSYDKRVEDAEARLAVDNGALGDEFAEAQEFLAEAIELDPDREEGYNAMLKYITEQASDRGELITSEEARAMNKLLNSNSTSDQTYYSIFQANNPQGAVEFSVNYGRALALQYDGSNYLQPLTYLEYAKGNLEEDSDQWRLVNCLVSLCELKSNEMSVNNTADYKGFWDNAWNMTHNGEAEKSEEELKAAFNYDLYAEYKFFKFMIAEITISADDFQGDGVELQQMYDMANMADNTVKRIELERDYFSEIDNQEATLDAALNKLASLND